MRLLALASAPILAALLVALALSLVWAGSLPVDDPYSIVDHQWNGTSKLAERGFAAITSNFADTLASANTPAVLLVLAPSRQFTVTDAGSIMAFVVRGGMLVVADRNGSANGLLELIGVSVRFDGRTLIDPLFYRKQPTFPVIFDLPRSAFSVGVDEVVLDYATVLTIRQSSGIQILASSSGFSFLDENNDGALEPALEPAGEFPVLAEVAFGGGAIVLFTSPASFVNGLIDEASNDLLLENMVKRASQSTARPVLMLDETHLEPSPFTPAKLAAQRLVAAVVRGGMCLSEKLALMGLAVVIITARFMYRKPPRKIVEKGEPMPLGAWLDVESVMRPHPTWDRRKLEYVAREVEAAMRWRRLHEGE